MISKTKLGKRVSRKSNPELVETILACKKNEAWMKVGQILSGSSRTRPAFNLDQVIKAAEKGKRVVVPGKILSQGDLDKKVEIVAFDFSKGAMKKILNVKGEAISILEEIKKNPDAKSIKILTE